MSPGAREGARVEVYEASWDAALADLPRRFWGRRLLVHPETPLPVRLSLALLPWARLPPTAHTFSAALARGEAEVLVVPASTWEGARPLPLRPPGELSGRSVLLTRPLEKDEAVVAALEAEGCEVLRFPVVTTVLAEPARLRQEVGEISRFDFVVFTSERGVAALLRAFPELPGMAAPPCLAAVGPATAAHLARAGLSVALVAAEHRAEGLFAALSGKVRPGSRILLPRAKEGRDFLERELRALGCEVVAVTAYETVRLAHPLAGEVAEHLRRGGVDAVLFFSPSAAASFAERIGVPPVPAIAIGPETAKALLRLGASRVFTAKRYTGEGVVAEVRAVLRGEDREEEDHGV